MCYLSSEIRLFYTKSSANLLQFWLEGFCFKITIRCGRQTFCPLVESIFERQNKEMKVF